MTHHHHPASPGDTAEPVSPTAFWEGRYSEAPAIWSGKVNATFAPLVEDLTPGISLDLACGEGADVMWLASKGWTATGVDLSVTAIARARAAAADAGLANASFEAHDLETWEPGVTFDLVSSAFMHSPVALERIGILSRAASWVAPGGHLVILSHAEPPPWSDPERVSTVTFASPEEELDALALDPHEWTVVQVGTVEREVNKPDFGPALLLDGVIVAQRRSA